MFDILFNFYYTFKRWALNFRFLLMGGRNRCPENRANYDRSPPTGPRTREKGRRVTKTDLTEGGVANRFQSSLKNGLLRIIIPLIIIGGGGYAGYHNWPTIESGYARHLAPDPKLNIDEDLIDALTELGLSPEIIQETVAYYKQQYGCRVDKIDFEHNSYEMVNGLVILETASPGRMGLDPQAIAGVNGSSPWNREATKKEFVDTILHALTHSCQNREKRSNFGEGLVLLDGAKVLEIQGFSVQVLLPSNEYKQFGLIEEGAAEALVAMISPEYVSLDPGYFNVGFLVYRLAKNSDISPQELARMVQNSDLEGFITKVMGRPAVPADLADFINIFALTFNQVIPVPEAIALLRAPSQDPSEQIIAPPAR